MIIDLEGYAYYIRPGYTDMRKQAFGLSQIVQEIMKLKPFSKSVFIFCGRSRKTLKAIVWDKNGWLEITKRLECHETFYWPTSEEEARLITLEQVKGLLAGYDIFRALPVLNPKVVI